MLSSLLLSTYVSLEIFFSRTLDPLISLSDTLLTCYSISLSHSSLYHLSLQRILERLVSENMLYVVPWGANDDWYWIYATVMEGRESTAYVVI